MIKQKRKRDTIGAFLLVGILGITLFSAQAVCIQKPVPDSVQEENQSTQAAEITQDITISAHGIDKASHVLTDRDRDTKILLLPEKTVTITSEQLISSLYVIWDHVPDSWRLICDGKEIPLDHENRFLHDYIELPADGKKIEIKTDNDAGVICDIYFFGHGAPPDWIQRWRPPHERADLLLLPAHACDELLCFGGAAPYYAAGRGYRVQVAYMTNHNGESYRLHELLDGLWTCGIRAYPVIGDFPDYYSESLEHAITLYGLDNIMAYQTEMIRRFKPYVVIGHDVNGEYGHGAHRLNAYSLMKITDKTDNPEWHPESAEKYGVWKLPKLYLHLYPKNEIIMDWDVPIEAFGGKTAYEIAGEGYQCHVSQRNGFQMGGKGAYDSTRFGLAYTAVGPDLEKNDFFENIVFEDEELRLPIGSDGTEISLTEEQRNSAETEKKPELSTVLLIASAVLMLFILAAVLLKKKKQK